MEDSFIHWSVILAANFLVSFKGASIHFALVLALSLGHDQLKIVVVIVILINDYTVILELSLCWKLSVELLLF